MPRFKVTLTADAYMSADIEITDAVNADDARAYAIQRAMEGNVDWDFQGVNTETIEAQDEQEIPTRDVAFFACNATHSAPYHTYRCEAEKDHAGNCHDGGVSWPKGAMFSHVARRMA